LLPFLTPLISEIWIVKQAQWAYYYLACNKMNVVTEKASFSGTHYQSMTQQTTNISSSRPLGGVGCRVRQRATKRAKSHKLGILTVSSGSAYQDSGTTGDHH